MAKNRAEVAGDGISSLLKSGDVMNRRIDFVLQAGDGTVGDPARHDQVEVAQVGGHVQRKSVRGDPREICTPMAAIFFSGIDPPGSVQTPVRFGIRCAWDAIAGAGANEDFFQLADIVDGAEHAVDG